MSRNTYGYEDAPEPRRAGGVGRVVNLVLSAGIVIVLVLAGVYTASPIDVLPDLIPGLGQADDLLAILAGGGSVGVLTVLRFLVNAIINPQSRRTCLLLILAAAVPLVACLGAGLIVGLALRGSGG